LLADAWSRLVGQPPEAAAPGALDDLARGLSLRWDESRRSYTIVVGARGPGRDAAIARANAVADALVAWDDARARAAADKVTASLELQLATLEDQLAALRASGSRANLPQIAAVSLLTVRVRDAIALSRAQAVVARGNLEFLQPATRASQVAPSPLVDAFTVFVLTTLAVLAVGLARAGTDRRVHAASGLAEVAGVPMLADLSRAPAPGPGKRGYSELGFLKAHLDRTVGAGGEVLVAGMADHAAVQHVAAALDRLYAQAGAAASLKVGAALLGAGEAIGRAARADAVLLVAEPRATDRVELREAMAWLRRASANVIGVVAAGPAGRRPARRTAWGSWSPAARESSARTSRCGSSLPGTRCACSTTCPRAATPRCSRATASSAGWATSPTGTPSTPPARAARPCATWPPSRRSRRRGGGPARRWGRTSAGPSPCSRRQPPPASCASSTPAPRRSTAATRSCRCARTHGPCRSRPTPPTSSPASTTSPTTTAPAL